MCLPVGFFFVFHFFDPPLGAVFSRPGPAAPSRCERLTTSQLSHNVSPANSIPVALGHSTSRHSSVVGFGGFGLPHFFSSFSLSARGLLKDAVCKFFLLRSQTVFPPASFSNPFTCGRFSRGPVPRPPPRRLHLLQFQSTSPPCSFVLTVCFFFFFVGLLKLPPGPPRAHP